MVYSKEIPKHKVYLINTPENVIFVADLFKKVMFHNIDKCPYIEVNFKTGEARQTFTFEWLYRNQPNCISKDELFLMLRYYKIKKINENTKTN